MNRHEQPKGCPVPRQQASRPAGQQGVVLLVMLALLFVATLLGIAMVASTTGETRMAALRSQRESSHTLAQAAAAALALKGINSVDPNAGLPDLPQDSQDCTNLTWQGGLGDPSTQSGVCTITLEKHLPTDDKYFFGELTITAGSSAAMANQLRAKAAVMPLLSGLGPIIGAPGKAGFVVAAKSISPDPKADPNDPSQKSWLDRKGAWYLSLDAAQSQGTQGTRPFALKTIPKPGAMPDEPPWTTYNWQDYKRGLGSDAVATLRGIALEVDGVAKRYEELRKAYEEWVKAQRTYTLVKDAALAAAIGADAAGATIGAVTQLVTLVLSAAGLPAQVPDGSNTIGALMDLVIQTLEDAGNDDIDKAAAVIAARQAIRDPWETLADLHTAEQGGQAIWKCGDDDTDRMKYNTEGLLGAEVDLAALMVKPDADFQEDTANNMPLPANDVIEGIAGVLPGGLGENVIKLVDAAAALQSIAQGDDPANDRIGTAINDPKLGDTSAEDEPRFMLILADNNHYYPGTAGGLVQTNPMCKGGDEDPDNPAELVICKADSGWNCVPAQDASDAVQVRQVTVVHTGPINLKAEAPLEAGRVSTILVSNEDLTVESAAPDMTDPAGLLLWADGKVNINRPVSGAVVAGGTVTVDQSDKTMLTYNPALDPKLLGADGKFPLAGYTLGSWTSLASAQ